MLGIIPVINEADALASDLVVVATPNFSALQILEAGRRAEAEGNRDHAVQFYRHLTLHFAGTFEAADAVTALHRLEDGGPRYAFGAPAHMAGAERTSPPLSVSGSVSGVGRPVFATPLLGPPLSPGPLNLDGDARHRTPQPAARLAQSAERITERPIDRAVEDAPGRQRARKQKVRDRQEEAGDAHPLPRFRFGRFLALVLTVVGSAGTILGVCALAAGSVLPASRTANTLATAILASPAIAGGFTLAALVLLLVGQMARAIFALILHQRNHDGGHGRSAPHEHDDGQ
jgi:hypothetical protein